MVICTLHDGTDGKWNYNTTHSISRHSMVETGQPHAPTALPPRKALPVRTEQEDGWAPDLVWMFSEQINVLPLQPGCKLS
jgi:hypothetical protein